MGKGNWTKEHQAAYDRLKKHKKWTTQAADPTRLMLASHAQRHIPSIDREPEIIALREDHMRQMMDQKWITKGNLPLALESAYVNSLGAV
jgi:hypothetical protein